MKIKLPKFKFPEKLKSRKLWLALFAAVFPVLNQFFGWGLDQEVVVKAFTALMGWVLVEGVADVASRINKK